MSEERNIQLPKISKRELGHILACLRYVQNEDFKDVFNGMFHFQDFDPLTDEQVDVLCEEINVGPQE